MTILGAVMAFAYFICLPVLITWRLSKDNKENPDA